MASNQSNKRSGTQSKSTGSRQTKSTQSRSNSTRKPAANKKTTTRSTTSRSATRSANGKGQRQLPDTSPVHDELIMIIMLAVSILLVLSTFDLCGRVGQWLGGFMFGMGGFLAYFLPYILFLGTAFWLSNRYNPRARFKFAMVIALYILLMAVLQMATGNVYPLNRLGDYYATSEAVHSGGGIIGGLICSVLHPLFDTVGTYFLLIIFILICVVLITGKAILAAMGHRSVAAYKKARTYRAERKEAYREELQRRMAEEDGIDDGDLYGDYEDIDETEKALAPAKKKRENKRNIVLPVSETPIPQADPNALFQVDHEALAASVQETMSPEPVPGKEGQRLTPADAGLNGTDPLLNFTVKRMEPVAAPAPETVSKPASQTVSKPVTIIGKDNLDETGPIDFRAMEDELMKENFAINAPKASMNDIVPDSVQDMVKAAEGRPELVNPLHQEQIRAGSKAKGEKTEAMAIEQHEEAPKVYEFPPLKLLVRGKSAIAGISDNHLRETALKLQTTLESFGVRVQVTNVSCGPSVTRYELQPDQGVKVSRIVGLSDDIKLNLAVADIRIEAPIPGKAAVGIEVPNKENSTVMLRELLESKAFSESNSNIAFAVGRDIAGQVIVTDLAKMPHLLIAGATGSGKSVCINTLIMSILYKSKPEDVRMIMVDPKVVELNVYNGIPHLLIPVVTDPKKAAGALNWAVLEMEDRYKKFAELGVRDLKGYNAKILASELESETHKKLPQIVIIVDELADLMMVAQGEVEDAICRLAQLARACGIHLVIATQRPSVNVITGLIKANVPSRIAFSVSSGVDSRTIIDMNGAEKLLGKGDMLFYPSGYQKPVRVQGAFVSDEEVSAVVDYITDKSDKPQYSEEITSKITSTQSAAESSGGSSDRDVYFVEAGRFIIEKDKASIGMLQRVYRIGFNRAARIMDQLFEAGVVGPEEGTKPRKIMMTMDEFERYVEEYV